MTVEAANGASTGSDLRLEAASQLKLLWITGDLPGPDLDFSAAEGLPFALRAPLATPAWGRSHLCTPPSDEVLGGKPFACADLRSRAPRIVRTLRSGGA